MNTLFSKLQSSLLEHRKELNKKIYEEDALKKAEEKDPCLSTINDAKKKVRTIVFLIATMMALFAYVIVEHSQSLELEQINRSVSYKVAQLSTAPISYKEKKALAEMHKEEMLDQMYTNRITTSILFGAVMMVVTTTISYLDKRDYFITGLNKKTCNIK